MSKLFWQIVKTTPAVALASAVFTSGSAFAQTVAGEQTQTPNVNETLQQVDQYTQQGNSLDQVNSVTQFSDVQPTDWAYEALRGLVERYGCIAGYPNGTYRGNRALTRYEFAAGLYACLLQIERLIAASGSEVTQEDLAALERLVTEFEAELATLGTRVDNLEARLGEVEENQFSTTTKLDGEVIFSFVEPFGDEDIQQFALDPTSPGDVVVTGTENTEDVNSTFSNRVRLNFDASFYGEDRLRIRLESANIPDFGDALGTDAARLGFDGISDDNNIEVNDLYYRFPVGDYFQATVGASGMGIEDVFNVANPVFEDSGTGTVTRFFRRNPAVYRTGNDGAGAAVSFGILGDATIDLAYLVDDDGVSEPGGLSNSLFSGNFDYAAQLNISPFDNLDLALTYVYSYYERGIGTDLSGGTSSAIAQNPFGLVAFDFGDEDDEVTANRYGAQLTYQFGERFSLGGWYGLVDADAEGTTDAEATVSNWAVHAALLDFGKEGAVLGGAFGQLPKVTDSEGLFPGQDAGDDFEEEDSSYLAELQYRYPIGENVLITPAVYAIFNANNNEDNDTVYVGVLRTTFKF